MRYDISIDIPDLGEKAADGSLKPAIISIKDMSPTKPFMITAKIDHLENLDDSLNGAMDRIKGIIAGLNLPKK